MKTLLKSLVSFWLSLVLIFLAVFAAHGVEYMDGKLDISGYLENFTAYRYDEPKHYDRGYFSNCRNTFYLEAGYKLVEESDLSLSFNITLRHFYESAAQTA